MESILDSIKKSNGIEPEDTAFDIEMIIHINSVIATLTQLGVGPNEGYEIVDNKSSWPELIGDRKDLNDVRTYIYLKTRLIFDPPQNSFLVASIEKQCLEYEWRIAART